MGWRTILGLPIAGAIAMGLFLLMAGLIKTDEILDEPEVREVPEILITFEAPTPEPVKPTPPDVIDQPDPPDDIKREPRSIDPIKTDPLTPPKPGEGDDPVNIAVDNLEPTAIVQVAPTGFENCLSGDVGSQNRVRVQFDVSPEGLVANPEVVASTDRCFERAALRAVQQWRYRPVTRNGEAVWFYGYQTTIIFEEG